MNDPCSPDLRTTIRLGFVLLAAAVFPALTIASPLVEIESAWAGPTMDSNRDPGLDMGAWRMYGESAEYPIRLNNRDTGDIHIQSVRVSEGVEEFAYLRGCTPIWRLVRNGWCDVSVRFRPLAAGERRGALEVTYSESAGSSATYTLPLIGQGIASRVELSPTSHNFGAQALGVSSDHRVTLTNRTQEPLQVQSARLDWVSHPSLSVFSVDNDCRVQVAIGASCQVGAIFTPTTAGNQAATLAIRHSAHAQTISIPLQGAGDPELSPLSLTPDRVNFGARQLTTPSPERSITVTNTASTPLVVTSVDLERLQSEVFEFLVSNRCTTTRLERGPPLTLSRGESCDILLTFVPRQRGERRARLRINHSGRGTSAEASLEGVGEGDIPFVLVPVDGDPLIATPTPATEFLEVVPDVRQVGGG